ncbi:MAG: hypothetical protein GY862_15020 [Gammaproteobacteria bacterium]|nr:hypothetical protein [Gammaproteobacteria bacterium]
MSQQDKDTQDWLDALAGRHGSDANPDTLREAEALREELQFRNEQPETANPRILSNVLAELEKEPPPVAKRNNRKKNLSRKAWWTTAGLSLAAAASIMIAVTWNLLPTVMAPVKLEIIIQRTQPDEQGIVLRPKSPDGEKVILRPKSAPSNPQVIAERLREELKKLGIAVTLVNDGNKWILRANVPSDKNRLAKVNKAVEKYKQSVLGDEGLEIEVTGEL